MSVVNVVGSALRCVEFRALSLFVRKRGFVATKVFFKKHNLKNFNVKWWLFHI